jgi:glycosyltransferase involved in cell wall biosynthesis
MDAVHVQSTPEDGLPAPQSEARRRVAVVIPAHNEERFIGSVVLKLLRHPVAVIVVDDGSSDETAAIAEAAGASVVRHPHNLGKGQALNSGILAARRLAPDVLVMIDGDGQHLPEQLPALVGPILAGKADIVVGSRYLLPTSRVSAPRRLGHWFFNRLTGLASQVHITDSQSGFRAFSPRAYTADLFTSPGFTVESEMQFLAHEHGLRIIEVPITIRYPDKPKRPALRQGLSVLNGILHLVGQYRPLLFFGLSGLIVALAGFGMGVLVVEIYRRSRELAVGYAMISVLLSIAGMVLFSTGVTLHSVRGLLLDLLKKNGHSDGP